MTDPTETGQDPSVEGAHPDGLLSAVAVGDTGADVDAAAEHVAGCPRCTAIVEDERAVRGLLSDLPPIEPPERFFTDLIRRRHRQAIAVASAGVLAAAGAWALLIGAESGVTGQVVPDVAMLRARHMASAEAVPDDFEPMHEDHDMPAPYSEPVLLAGRFAVVERFHGADDVIQVIYSDGDTELSLFEQAGALQEDDLPGDMAPVDLGDGGWELAADPVRVVVVRRGDLVYTLVGSVDRSLIERAVADLPAERPMAVSVRITIAVDNMLEDLGLGL
jgi:hypothetical protein